LPEVLVEFAERDQSIGALREAAYRLIGQATCRIETSEGIHLCRLEAAHGKRIADAELRARFLDLVTDENLREKIAAATEPTRNVILALAFGALARAEDARS